MTIQSSPPELSQKICRNCNATVYARLGDICIKCLDYEFNNTDSNNGFFQGNDPSSLFGSIFGNKS